MKNEYEREDERLLMGLEPPPPPADLRARALAAARQRLAETPAPDLWSKIWHSSGLRLAWAAAVVLLLAGHVLVSPNLDTAFTANPPVLAADQRDEQFLDILRPVQINANAQPTIGLFAAVGDLDQIEDGGNPS
ncbi:MAG: hypothetical protein QNL88_09705 [Acidobacteriota bacterium]|nr:hypothetical protein [Acidobacteriota bacterium]